MAARCGFSATRRSTTEATWSLPAERRRRSMEYLPSATPAAAPTARCFRSPTLVCSLQGPHSLNARSPKAVALGTTSSQLGDRDSTGCDSELRRSECHDGRRHREPRFVLLVRCFRRGRKCSATSAVPARQFHQTWSLQLTNTEPLLQWRGFFHVWLTSYSGIEDLDICPFELQLAIQSWSRTETIRCS